MEERTMKHKYIPSRLVRYAEMGDYRWRYCEAPRSLAHQMGGLPVSEHEWGVIETNRFMLETAVEKAGLKRFVKLEA
jgi:hypothetical protein